MFKRLKAIFTDQPSTHQPSPPSATGIMQVAADASRCVQCGICGYNCPVGIDVRAYARRGENVTDSRCITCGACVENCPRGTLRWGTAVIVRPDQTLEVNPDDFVIPLHLFKREQAFGD